MRCLLLVSLFWLVGCEVEGSEERPVPTFDELVDTVFADSCAGAGCHGATSGAGGLFLEGERAYDSLLNEPCADEEAISSGFERVVPGDPSRSFLMVKITDPMGMGDLMPPGMPLDDAAVEDISRWIEAGARR